MNPKQVSFWGYVTPANGGPGWLPIQVESNGILIVSPPTNGSGDQAQIIVSQETLPANTESLAVSAFLYGQDPSGNFDPLQATGNENDGIVPVDAGVLETISQLFAFNGTGFDRVLSNSTEADGFSGSPIGNVQTLAQLYGWDGGAWDRVRVANIFKTVTATAAGATTVWTPAAGKKFRLMGFLISVAGTMAATGVQSIELIDGSGGTVIKNFVAGLIQTPSASIAPVGAVFPGDLGQGQLSSTANNALEVSLGTAMATGNVSVNVWGTEE